MHSFWWPKCYYLYFYSKLPPPIPRMLHFFVWTTLGIPICGGGDSPFSPLCYCSLLWYRISSTSSWVFFFFKEWKVRFQLFKNVNKKDVHFESSFFVEYFFHHHNLSMYVYTEGNAKTNFNRTKSNFFLYQNIHFHINLQICLGKHFLIRT